MTKSNPLFVDTDDIAEAVNAIANPREHLVGEGKKFKTDDDLARGKLYSDLYVPKLEQKNNELQTQLDQVNAEIAILKSRATETVQMVNETATPTSSNTNVTEDKVDVDALVDKRLASIRDADKRQANLDLVRNTLEQTLGDNYGPHMKQLGDEYGTEYLLNMAQENPKAFLKLAGATNATATPVTSKSNDLFVPPANSLNTRVNTETVRGHKYYHELRRTDPRKFNSPEVFKERLAAMTRLGDKYFQS